MSIGCWTLQISLGFGRPAKAGHFKRAGRRYSSAISGHFENEPRQLKETVETGAEDLCRGPKRDGFGKR